MNYRLPEGESYTVLTRSGSGGNPFFEFIGKELS